MKVSRLFWVLLAIGLLIFCITCSDDNKNASNGSDGDADGDSDVDGDSDSDSDSACVDTTVDISADSPTVLLLVDRSSSMGQDFGGDTRWNVARDAMINPDNGFIPALEDEIRFGLTMYAGATETETCPSLETVDPALNNYQAIYDIYSVSEPLRNTPTSESILAAAQILADDDAPGNKVIVLVTDGVPDTCANPDGQNEEAQANSVQAVETANANGISTYVVSVGEQENTQHFQDLADAGLNTTDAPYYEALSPEALTQAFTSIITGVRKCLFSLNGSVVEGQESECSVTFADEAITYDDPDGWRLNTRSQIELVGDACTTIQNATEGVLDVHCNCGAFTPPE